MVGSFSNSMNDPFARLETEQNLLDFTKFDGSDAFNTIGFSDSNGAASGRAGTTEVDAKKLEEAELIRGKRDELHKTSELMALGQEMRQSRIESVTYSNGQFHMFGMSIDEEDMDASVDDTLKNIDDVADKHNLDAGQKAELTTLLLAYQSADTPQEKAEILTKIAETQPEIAKEIAEDAPMAGEKKRQADLNAEETQDAANSGIQDNLQYQEANSKIVDRAEVAEQAVAVREGVSASGNPFEAGFNPSADFNASAAGLQVAASIKPQALPEVQSTAPTLANG